MKYIELLGLPGSGKTTLLQSFRRRGLAGQAGRVVLSEDWAMVLRRFGHRDAGLFRSLMKRGPGVPIAEVFRDLARDHWQMGVFSEYPELFSQIFCCLETVSPEDRQRAILLNYWRSRISLYLDVSPSTHSSFCVVDEGLSQTVFSTMSRMSAPSNRKLGLVDSILGCLPPERTVVMLRTPRDLIDRRVQSVNGRVSMDLSRRIEELDFIFHQQKEVGGSTFELDGSLGFDELLMELGACVTKAVGGQQL